MIRSTSPHRHHRSTSPARCLPGGSYDHTSTLGPSSLSPVCSPCCAHATDNDVAPPNSRSCSI